MTDVLLLDPHADEVCELLRQAAPELSIICNAEEADRCPIWLGEPDVAAALLAQGAKPRWLQSTWAGFKPLLAAGLPRDYRLSRAVGVFGQPIAEYILAYMLRHRQQLDERSASQARGEWNHRQPHLLAGQRVLIVGAGDIGSEVAGFLQPFGVELIGIARTPRAIAHFSQVVGMEQLPGMVGSADYLINILPDTPATSDVYDAGLFAAMRPSALFINVGRGSAVVDADLVSALQQGLLAGAVLDVFRAEPLPAGHPFWRTPNLTITGHIAGPAVPSLLVRLFVDNLARLQRGETLRGEVSFEQDY
ncbi:D-2-hydroxyacid dehydrogenase [Affinibrenneria salicis]|uniref:D-2-hydroxyacid dehydrogenase n=1 Tax=Affinibrenneria salicis TaxID=2590031 RepID=A0A5J5FQ88_9GAMM|nr:D-2-hydroxyacid dehydrogenase [Affinibrenneria salicis]KAA8995002.1 D-2-hydroxyacid dehydrogenase [Affinibrenneria salicis]